MGWNQVTLSDVEDKKTEAQALRLDKSLGQSLRGVNAQEKNSAAKQGYKNHLVQLTPL